MIDYIKIEGYKSIKSMELDLKPINIFIGSNGAGKSNLVSFFRLINAIFNKQLQGYMKEEKIDSLLYFGRKMTESMYGKLIFSEYKNENNAYWFKLAYDKQGGDVFIKEEGSGYNVDIDSDVYNYFTYRNLDESHIQSSGSYRDKFLSKYLSGVQVYHFHDTSHNSWLRRECDVDDNRFLKSDGRNLPAFLYYLQEMHPKAYKRIVKTIKSIAPYIDKFILEPKRLNDKEIELRWVDKGDLNSDFSAYQLSDGTLRFIALATVLLQPEPPKVIIIDEPELGLHPLAISKLSGMIQSASTKAQIIVSTQSVSLVDNFEPIDIVTVDRSEKENQSIFHRLDPKKLDLWLQDHSLGELWERNIINSAQPFTK